MVRLEDIITELGANGINDKELPIIGVSSLDDAKDKKHIITWSNETNIEKIKDLSEVTVVIPSKTNLDELPKTNSYIFSPNPRRYFSLVIRKFFDNNEYEIPYVPGSVTNNSILPQKIHLGNNVVIGKNVTIGSNVVILHNTVILDNTIIGNDVMIGCNNTIGGCGFGYNKNEDGEYQVIPHVGNVVIEDNVDIGNNVAIDRAVMGSTLIKKNSKIDNLVHIAHGVTIGENSVVIANAMIAGSVVIGDNCWIAPSSSIIQKKKIGNNSLVGLGAVVLQDIPENSVTYGNPAKISKHSKND